MLRFMGSRRVRHESVTELNSLRASQVSLSVKNLPASVGRVRHMASIPVSGRSPGGEHGNPLQSSCLENPIDKRDSLAMVHRVAKSWTQLK